MGALLQGFPEESSVVPGRIFVQGFPRSCSQRSYPYRAPPDCQEDHTVPVTWLYGGDAESEFASRSLWFLALTRSIGYFGFANGTRLPETGSELTLNTGWNWVNLGLPYDTPALNVSATYLPSVTNILQLLISAIRLDFGIVLPNNPYLNMSVMTDTLQETMPTEGMRQQLIGRLGDPENIVAFEMDSFVSGLPAYLSAEYQCRFKYQKGWSESNIASFAFEQTHIYPGLSSGSTQGDRRDVGSVCSKLDSRYACDCAVRKEATRRFHPLRHVWTFVWNPYRQSLGKNCDSDARGKGRKDQVMLISGIELEVLMCSGSPLAHVLLV